MSRLNILVVGASIAGPATAYWFARAGANVTVIERYPQLREGGQAIDIRSLGVTIMRKTPGMETSVRANKVDEEGIQWVRADGTPFATMRPTGNPDQQTLISEYEILRGDLLKILYNMTKDHPRIKYVFEEQVKSIHQKGEEADGPATVEFLNGYPTSQYDLVVACDGTTSRTRAIGLGCGVRDHIRPLDCWAAYFTMKSDVLNGGKMGQSYSAVGGRWLALGPDKSGATRVMMMGIFPRNKTDAMNPYREAAKQGDRQLREYVADHFKGVGWKTDEVLEDMMEATDFYSSEIAQVKVPALSKGRFVMVGDAGYAGGFTGAGTTLALGGAYLLAGEIAKNKGNLKAGLKSYEERMKPLIKDLGNTPPGIPGVLSPQTAWGIWIRDTIIRFVLWTKVHEWAGKLLTAGFDKDKYGIPDYEWEE